MIEETARHAGHLDTARELLGGGTGRGQQERHPGTQMPGLQPVRE
jgi:hypothetical protein